MITRAALASGVLSGLLLAGIGNASAQQVGAFEKIPSDQSPISFKADTPGQTAFLRQYRDNSTVFVGRWFGTRSKDEAPEAASDLYLETVFTTSAAGFRFSAAMSPGQLLDMFASLQSQTRINGDAFSGQTRYGPIEMVPFARAGSQCVTFVGQWDPQTPTQRSSRLLGYYCTPRAELRPDNQDAPPTELGMTDARTFAAGFFERFNLQLPDGTAIAEQPAMIETVLPPSLPEGPVGSNVPDGIGIITNWQGMRGTGILRFDQPAGEGSMVVNDEARHCEGVWRHEGGRYQTDTLPFGSWYFYCDNGDFARGYYTSEDPSSVTGDGKDNEGQAVYFRQAN